MKLKTLLVISSVVAVLFGLSFMFFPVWSEAAYGVNLDMGGQLMARYFGSALLGVGALIWFVRNISQPEAQRAIATGLFITMVAGFLVAVYDRALGIENALAWSTIVLYLLFSIGYGYFAFRKPKPVEQAV